MALFRETCLKTLFSLLLSSHLCTAKQQEQKPPLFCFGGAFRCMMGPHDGGALLLNNNKEIKIKIDNPHLWSTDDPYLYDLEVSTDKDKVNSYFGLREIKVINNKLFFTW